ncbi:hypothetical protein McpSp1_03430 [Methanocorpusculaceae archaeon Sp1]|nr:hypothetical protein [Methanocorpusculaceae archaeon Sp1]
MMSKYSLCMILSLILLVFTVASGCVEMNDSISPTPTPISPPFIPGTHDKPLMNYPQDQDGHAISIRIDENNCTGFSEIRHEQGEYGMPVFVLAKSSDAVIELRVQTQNSSAVVEFEGIEGLPTGAVATADPESFIGDYQIVRLHIKTDDSPVFSTGTGIIWMKSGAWQTGKFVGFE